MQTNKLRSCWLFLVDQLLAAAVFAPLTVGYWRGTWLILGYVSSVADLDTERSSWISAVIGNVGTLILAVLQQPIQRLLKRERFNKPCDFIIWLLGYHVYTYILAFFMVNVWRGTWNLLNVYYGTGLLSNVLSVSIGLTLLLCLRASKNCMGAPLAVAEDTDTDFFSYSTRFRTKPSLHENFVWDCVLTVLLIHNLVVFYWRGTWQVMDHFWYSDDPSRTVLISLCTGYGAFLVCVPFQLLAHAAYKRVVRGNYHIIFKVVVEDLVFMVGIFASVAIWRGIWLACDQHIWPENHLRSILFTHSVGIGGLWLLRCGHTLIPRGCLIDGESPGSLKGAAMFPNAYLRLFLDKCPERGSMPEDSTKYTEVEAKISSI